MYSGVERQTTSASCAAWRASGPENFRDTQGKASRAATPGRDQGDLGQDEGGDDTGQGLRRQDRRGPVAQRRPGRKIAEAAVAHGAGHDVVGQEAHDIAAAERAAGRDEEDDTRQDVDRQQARADPDRDRRDERVEQEKEGGDFRVVAVLERGIEEKSQGRQADEAENGTRAQAALQAVERIGAKMDEHVGQADEQEDGQARRLVHQRAQERLLVLVQDLGVDLGEDAAIGNRDREQAGQRREAEHLQEQQCPEQLVDRAQEGHEGAHGCQVVDERSAKNRSHCRERRPRDRTPPSGEAR